MARWLIGVGMLFLIATLAVQAQERPGVKQPGNPPGAALRNEEKQPINPQPIPASMALTELQGRSLSSWLQDLKHPDPSVREQAISILPLFGEAIGNHEAVSLLLNCCNDRDASPRIRAVMVLNSMEIKPGEVSRVVEMLKTKLHDQQSQIRYYAGLGLPRFGHDARGAIPGLVDLAGDQTTFELRRVGLAALSIIGRTPGEDPDKRAVAAMINRSSDPAVAVRLEAVKGLGMLGKTNDPQLAPLVDKALNNAMRDKDQRVVIWAKVSSMAIDKIDSTKIHSIAGLLHSTDVAIRQHATLALAAVGPNNKIVLDKLFAALRDKDSGVVINAMGAILASGEKGLEVVNPLKDLKEARDTPEWLKLLCQAAIEGITRKRPNEPAAPNKNPGK